MPTVSLSEKKPDSIAEYTQWLSKVHGISLLSKAKNQFEYTHMKAVRELQTDIFWSKFLEERQNISARYTKKTGAELFSSPAPEVLSKSFDSFFLKTFRKNVLQNENWPLAPSEGWYLPPRWLSQINDIIRATVSVRFLDGVPFLLGELQGLASALGCDLRCDFSATPKGYYAAHVYYRREYSTIGLDNEEMSVSLDFEVQISTQIKVVIKGILHKYYELERGRLHVGSLDWQWNYTSDEFVASYLGHMLHYLEGMIVGLREKQHEEV